jgi:hypothetical protein
VENGAPAGRFSDDRHRAGIAAEGRDVALQPAQRRELVLVAEVADGAFLRRTQRRVHEEAKRPRR